MPFSVPHSGGFLRNFPEGVKWLLIANIGVFVAYFFATLSGLGGLFAPFELVPSEVLGSLAIWQLATYLFLHDPGGFSHILFNMLTLWMFGADLERTWGRKRFLQYYFLCGIGAGICVVIASVIFQSGGRTIGASGAIYGLLLAFGMMYPDRQVLFSFLFPIKAKYFVMILGAIAFLSSFASSGGPVSHIAHLGGMLFGWAYLRSRSPARSLGRPQTSFWSNVRGQYEEWRLQRARRKFQVYMNKKKDQDPRVH
ncbi:MAG: rhomboid family intramembrane serine protease [Bryobacteraceae bacterium]|nr:rhomboid family intramembrane serine protease [Bryobacteraceae bacterium]